MYGVKKAEIALSLVGVAVDMRNIFLKSISDAKISGKLLAHALMLQFPFWDVSVSLIGFSLGTQVIYSCLEELMEYDCDYLSKFINYNQLYSQ